MQLSKMKKAQLRTHSINLRRHSGKNDISIAEKILNKYQNGVTYVDAEWKGNAEMLLDTKFTAKSQFDDACVVEVYEGISNEFKFSNSFRQKTKGREVWESKPT